VANAELKFDLHLIEGSNRRARRTNRSLPPLHPAVALETKYGALGTIFQGRAFLSPSDNLASAIPRTLTPLPRGRRRNIAATRHSGISASRHCIRFIAQLPQAKKAEGATSVTGKRDLRNTFKSWILDTVPRVKQT
jgi:hypothetical protein